MSNTLPRKSSRKKRTSECKTFSENLVTSFIDQKDDTSEPVAKKPKKTPKPASPDDSDDSFKFFKPRAKIYSAPSTSNIATSFINESSKKSVKPRAKPTSKPTKRKPKAQPDIRKVLSKQEQVFQHLVSENCLAEGTDPEEMQLALAISESLKYQNQSNESEASTSSKTETSKFENPFTSTGKVQPISAMLERFGFKSKKCYTEYELDLITSSKIAKRSKFQKFPTALTRTSNEKRDKLIRRKIDKILELTQSKQSEDFSGASVHDYQVFSFHLQELHEKLGTAFDVNCESRPTENILLNYYVVDLFEPSFVKAGHLLKDWSKIPGRDASPERNFKDCKDSTRIEVDELADDCILDKNEMDMNNFDKIDDHANTETRDTSRPEISEELFDPLQNTSNTSSCSDIFADIEDFEIDNVDAVIAASNVKETSGELANHLNKLHDKLSQSMIDYDETDNDDTLENHKYQLSIREDGPKMLAPQSDEDLDSSLERLENSVLQGAEQIEREEEAEQLKCEDEAEEIDLTQLESSEENYTMIPYDDSFYTLKQHINNIGGISDSLVREIMKESEVNVSESLVKKVMQETMLGEPLKSPVLIDLLSSDEDEKLQETSGETQAEKLKQKKLSDESDDEMFPEDKDEPMLSQNSLSYNDDDVIAISDEEINYSTRKYHNHNGDKSNESSDDEIEKDLNSIDLTQSGDEAEANFSHVDQSLVDILDQECSVNINDTVSNLLEASVVLNNLNVSKKDRSMKVHEADGLSDSLREIMRKYGGTSSLTSTTEKENSRSFRKMQSESLLGTERAKKRKTVEFSFLDDVVDSTPLAANDSISSFNNSLHISLENINAEAPRKPTRHQAKPKQSLGVQLDDDYFVDTETFVPEPDYKNMTPVELKQALFKFGIRPLPVKKAVQLLEYIYDQIHPKIRVAADEEIDINDSRRNMNITDIVANIGVQESDDFVFQPGLVEDEDIVLPKMRKSKIPTCVIPLHISFYNMVRSSEKIQKFILEYRPVELDQIHQHFRKFGLGYQPNDIIAFMDKRCITFKTKEKSYSKTHEKKKQKRAQKATQKNQK